MTSSGSGAAVDVGDAGDAAAAGSGAAVDVGDAGDAAAAAAAAVAAVAAPATADGRSGCGRGGSASAFGGAVEQREGLCSLGGSRCAARNFIPPRPM